MAFASQDCPWAQQSMCADICEVWAGRPRACAPATGSMASERATKAMVMARRVLMTVSEEYPAISLWSSDVIVSLIEKNQTKLERGEEL